MDRVGGMEEGREEGGEGRVDKVGGREREGKRFEPGSNGGRRWD